MFKYLRQKWISNVLQSHLDEQYLSYCDIFTQWDSILILFDNGHFGWFYLDIDNEIIVNNNSQSILWLIHPHSNSKYDTFLNQLSLKSQWSVKIYIQSYPCTLYTK